MRTEVEAKQMEEQHQREQNVLEHAQKLQATKVINPDLPKPGGPA
jgi:hypothetical protein